MESKSKRVLLIDDEPGQRRLLKKMFLEGGDFEVVEAMDGLDALNILLREKLRPDLMLVDLTMPFIDGLEFHSYHQKQAGIQQPAHYYLLLSGKRRNSSGNCATWDKRLFDQAGRKGSIIKKNS